jgi:hypothetical protein
MVEFSTDRALATLQNPIGLRASCPVDRTHSINDEAQRQYDQTISEAIRRR